MSLQPCAHDGRKRADTITCLARCDQFPRCHTPRSAQLRAEIREQLQAAEAERETVAAMLETLAATLEDRQHQIGDSGSAAPALGSS